MPDLLSFAARGLTGASWGGWILYFLATTQGTIVAVTLYLHRSQAHRGVQFHPAVAHLFRAGCWLSTGMVTRQWVAVHRKHHARCETAEDPHSPQVHGIRTVLWRGVDLYKAAAGNEVDLATYGVGTPKDWIERHLYERWSWLGPTLLAAISIVLFGVVGLALWALQMAWIPFWAAGVINGLGHWSGYRNFETPDTSANLVPWGLLIGGEELHNKPPRVPCVGQVFPPPLRARRRMVGHLPVAALGAGEGATGCVWTRLPCPHPGAGRRNPARAAAATRADPARLRFRSDRTGPRAAACW